MNRRSGRPKDIQEVILDVADQVQRRLGVRTTIDEYESRFVEEIDARGVQVSRRQATTLSLNGTPVETYLADVLLENEIVVEFKRMPAITRTDIMRFARFMRAQGLRKGLIINLSAPDLDYRQLDLSDD